VPALGAIRFQYHDTDSHILGCSVTEAFLVLGHELKFQEAAPAAPDHAQAGNSSAVSSVPQNTSELCDERSENLWQWITTRPDILVGEKREWNGLTLSETLSIPEASSLQTLSPHHVLQPTSTSTSAPSQKPRTQPRLYVSNAMLWEFLAGHGEDFHKLPRLEWQALLGIATSMENGILQGDLTKLTGQDKRSLPKRTDSLARKGYIEKRPALVRGCKTSKLWIRKLAPLPVTGVEESSNPALTQEAAINASLETMTMDLEPVPWRSSWMNDMIDCALLGKTIMAIVKAFSVIRYQDLRVKLGVKGHQWQMKVVARICRYLMGCGALKYVVAVMGDALFRDCVKFERDLTAEDLAYFATNSGYSHQSRKPAKGSAKTPELAKSIPTETWDPDKPLTTSVLDVILGCLGAGLTSKAIAFNTLGGHYRRHIASVAAAVSIKDLQPVHLRHLQARRVFCREGKQASFRFLPVNMLHQTLADGGEAPPLPLVVGETEYGFRPLPLMQRTRQSLVDSMANDNPRKRPPDDDSVAEAAPQPKRKRGRPRKAVAEPDAAPNTTPSATATLIKMVKKRGAKKGAAFVCEKCGGSWKNDVGLKYHQTKARTACNPSYVPEPPRPVAQVAPQTPRNGKQGRHLSRAADLNRARAQNALARRGWKGAPTDIRGSIYRSELANLQLIPVENEITQMSPGESIQLPGPMEVDEPRDTGISGLIQSSLGTPRDGVAEQSEWRQQSTKHNSMRRAKKSDGPPRSLSPELHLSTTADTTKRSDTLKNPISSAETAPAIASPKGRAFNQTPQPLQEHHGESGDEAPSVETAVPSEVVISNDIPPFQVQPVDRKLSRTDQEVRQVMDVIKYLVRVNDDAFPARAGLFFALARVFTKAFPGVKLPSDPTIKRAIKALAKEKSVVENVFFFRQPLDGSAKTGTPRKVVILIKSGVDPNSAKVDALKAKLKENKDYIPSAFEETSPATPAEVERTSLRRPGLGSVEVLDAPFYVSQVARIREQSQATVSAQRKQPETLRGSAAKTAVWLEEERLTFYPPNTGLGEGDAELLNPTEIAKIDFIRTPGTTLVFDKPTKIKFRDGIWRRLGTEYFDAEGERGSFTMEGPMHVQEWTKKKGNVSAFLDPERHFLPARRGRPPIRPSILQGPTPIKVSQKERALAGDYNTAADAEGRRLTEELLSEFAIDEIIMAAFVAVRTLLGGCDKRLDWGLIQSLFPDLALDNLRRSWTGMQRNRAYFSIIDATQSFQAAFPLAYEKGEVPPINFDDITGYDWPFLVRWTARLIRDSFVKLPLWDGAKQEGITRKFVLEENHKLVQKWSDKFYHPHTSVFARFEMATAEAAALDMSDGGDDVADGEDAMPTLGQVVLSWVKSLCITPVKRCPPTEIQARFTDLVKGDSRVVEDAVAELNSRRIIKKRMGLTPYQLSKPFEAGFVKMSHETKFQAASEFKRLLDETFRLGAHFKVPSMMEDGAVMALINLVAHERVRLVGDNLPVIPLGFNEGNYDTRRMAKSKLLLGLHLEPSDTYMYDEQLEILERTRRTQAPSQGNGKLTPFWYDFAGVFVPAIWVRSLCTVCFILDTRGAMSVQGLIAATDPYLEPFEVRLILAWGEETGLFVPNSPPGGFKITEWCWLVVGRQRSWQEPVEYGVPGKPKAKRGRPRRMYDISRLGPNLGPGQGE